MSEGDELMKRYGKRPAFEWFMRVEDKRYWRMTQDLIHETTKKMTALIVLSAAITLAIANASYFLVWSEKED